jgi:hypothetical protein
MKQSGYNEDEVLVLAGRLADEVADSLHIEHEDIHDTARNAAAEAAERVMDEWTGEATVPLPDWLRVTMTAAALAAAKKARRKFHAIRVTGNNLRK